MQRRTVTSDAAELYIYILSNPHHILKSRRRGIPGLIYSDPGGWSIQITAGALTSRIRVVTGLDASEKTGSNASMIR